MVALELPGRAASASVSARPFAKLNREASALRKECPEGGTTGIFLPAFW